MIELTESFELTNLQANAATRQPRNFPPGIAARIERLPLSGFHRGSFALSASVRRSSLMQT
ncbi:MAG: hypothetical protein ACREXM_21075 [Gammaproteobacteria bacterium]